MKYHVHKIEVNSENMREKLEQFLNTLDGEVIAVFQNVVRLVMMYGAKINALIVVEKKS